MDYRDNETVAFVNKIQDMTRQGDNIKIAEIDGQKYYDSERHRLVRICDLSRIKSAYRLYQGLHRS